MKLIKGGSITITGILQFEPELRYTPNGIAVCSFRLIDSITKTIQNCEAWESIGEDIVEADLKAEISIAVTGYHKIREYNKIKYDYFIVKIWELK
jgi:single-stranded DNA-binding protein